ncbi:MULTISPECIES: hypothetical protein [unclassified Haloferax]|uniref:hypothetical protein n=1 Tax=unclassified Haloferax TaxID=2625095 RepID=UPI002875AE0C|nr:MULTISPECIES: hypothetical protein [unclassified Haloferax]MDS0243749.1 hypothetical protein [Haloferax sp. S2CR25]MDS0446870.1 hypothetical protein [Haloferax sp. S2CR25-2]
MNSEIGEFTPSNATLSHFEMALRQLAVAIRENPQKRKTAWRYGKAKNAVTLAPIQENAVHGVRPHLRTSIAHLVVLLRQKATSIDGGYAGASERSERREIFSGAKLGAATMEVNQ